MNYDDQVKKKSYLAMTFQDVVGIKVKHLNMFATLSSFLRAFGLIVMLNDCAVPIESSEIKVMENSWCMGPSTFYVKH